MDSTLIAALGIAGMFALILLHVQIGIAMLIYPVPIWPLCHYSF